VFKNNLPKSGTEITVCLERAEEPRQAELFGRKPLEGIVPRDPVEETIVATPPRPLARSGGRTAVAGLAARRSSPNGLLEPVLAERGEVDHQVDGVGQPCR
jgi:hypothetical protein